MTYHELPYEWKVQYLRIQRDHPDWSENQIMQMMNLHLRYEYEENETDERKNEENEIDENDVYRHLSYNDKVKYLRLRREHPEWSISEILTALNFEKALGLMDDDPMDDKRENVMTKPQPQPEVNRYGVDMDYFKRKYPDLTDGQRYDVFLFNRKTLIQYDAERQLNPGKGHEDWMAAAIGKTAYSEVSEEGGTNVDPGDLVVQKRIAEEAKKIAVKSGIKNPKLMRRFNEVISNLTNLLAQGWRTVKEIASNAWGYAKDAWDTAKGVWDSICDFFDWW